MHWLSTFDRTKGLIAQLPGIHKGCAVVRQICITPMLTVN